MKPLLGRPVVWLALAAAFSLVNSFAAHRFRPVEQIDTVTYREFDWSSLEVVLSNIRTPGYPLFLDMVEPIGGAAAVPIAHWLMLIAACLVFYRGCAAAGVSHTSAVFAAAALMLSRASLKLGPLIIADSLAISLSIAATGFFLGTLSKNSGRGWWLGMIAVTFLTCLVRPAYLFLVVLWPLLALVFDRLILRRDEPFAAAFRRCLKYAAATFSPLIVYSLLRLIVVGHFGLVSFGGYNLIGVTGQFLEREMVDELSPGVQPLANGMLDRRDAFTGYLPPADFYAMEQMYNPTVWEFAVPVARELHPEDNSAVNTLMSELARELLMHFPAEYIRWLAWNGWHAVVQVFTLTALDRAVVFFVLLLVVAHGAALLRGPSPRASSAASIVDASDPAQRFRDLHLVFWTALSFAIGKGVLVVLVQAANDRYMSGVMTLLPAAMAVFAACYLRRVWPFIGLLDRKEP